MGLNSDLPWLPIYFLTWIRFRNIRINGEDGFISFPKPTSQYCVYEKVSEVVSCLGSPTHGWERWVMTLQPSALPATKCCLQVSHGQLPLCFLEETSFHKRSSTTLGWPHGELKPLADSLSGSQLPAKTNLPTIGVSRLQSGHSNSSQPTPTGCTWNGGKLCLHSLLRLQNLEQ